MFTKFFTYLFIVFFYLQALANPMFVNPNIFNPNFSASPVPIPAGTSIIPLCSYPGDPSCINQWSQGARPLSVTNSNLENLLEYLYYFPTFLSQDMNVKDPEGDENWEVFVPYERVSPRSSTSSKTRNKFYRNRKNPDKVRVTQTNSTTGETTTTEGTVVLVSETAIGLTKGLKEQKPVDPEDDQQAEDIKQQKPVDPEDDQQAEPEENITYVTTENTYGLPTTTKEVKPGCFVIKKQSETEAGFCFECTQNKSKEPVLSELDDNFFRNVKNYLKEVVKSSKKKIANQISKENKTTRICSPEISLKAIISNFEKTCPSPWNNFKKFFQKVYCESCKKGIPPEIMFAMMTVESSGKCAAEVNNSHENSAGLFQINARVHQCKDGYTANTPANVQCLKNPLNNMNKSIEILFDHYSKVNDSKPKSSSTCKTWIQMTDKERDKWRRGVSAYNGGPGWVLRAIEAGRNRQTLTNTNHLVGRHKMIRNNNYKNDPTSWEALRLYYFTERLSPGNTTGSGRKLNLTVSNLAHTEAVLGRNVKGSSRGLVEIWGEYSKQNKPDQCPK